MVPRKLKDAEEARSALAAVAASGLSRVAWARAHGINARSLNGWRLTLERQERAGAVAPLRLVELVAPRRPAAEARYQIRLGDVTVEVDDQFDPGTLRRLLSVVAGC